MILKTNDGVREICSIDILCEIRVKFNKKTVRLVQKAEDITEATALKINCSLNGLEMPFGDANIFIGNLQNEVLMEFVDTLTSTGVIDITKLEFQPKKQTLCMPEDFVFDYGKSSPYITSGCVGFNNQFNDFTNVGAIQNTSGGVDATCDSDSGHKEDLSSFSDEDLRKILLELADYTFLELGQMSRDELESEYDRLEVEE